MKVSFVIPSFGWVCRIVERLFPGVIDRADRFGKAKGNRRFWAGILEIGVEVDHRD